MDKILTDFLEKKKAEAKEAKEREIEKFLFDNGLYTKVYWTGNGKPDKKVYTQSEIRDGKEYWYYPSFPTVSEEEYEELKSVTKLKNFEEEIKYPKVIIVLKLLSVIMGFLSFIGVISALNNNNELKDLFFNISLLGICGSAVLYGFSKIIDYLYLQCEQNDEIISLLKKK